jgi:hypothetical protein
MPGGIGPVDPNTASACRRAQAGNPLLPGAGEAEIFYRLAFGRACYSYRLESLYFVDSRYAPVAGILRAVMHGLDRGADVEQLHLDPHRVFRGARRVPLAVRHAEVVVTALRLAGVEVTLLR